MTIKLNSNLYNWFFIYNQIVRITETKEAKKTQIEMYDLNEIMIQ